jgi:hypothetical protein
MTTIRATWKNGQLILDGPVDWPEGLRVVVEPEQTETEQGGFLEEGPISPEEIARILAAMDKVEPFEMTAEEKADAEAWLRKLNDYTIATTDKGIEDVFR